MNNMYENNLRVEIRANPNNEDLYFSDFYLEGELSLLAIEFASLAEERNDAIALLMQTVAQLKYNLNLIGDVELEEICNLTREFYEDGMDSDEFVGECESLMNISNG